MLPKSIFMYNGVHEINDTLPSFAVKLKFINCFIRRNFLKEFLSLIAVTEVVFKRLKVTDWKLKVYLEPSQTSTMEIFATLH